MGRKVRWQLKMSYKVIIANCILLSTVYVYNVCMNIKINKCQKCGGKVKVDRKKRNFFGYTVNKSFECTGKDCGYVTLVADNK